MHVVHVAQPTTEGVPVVVRALVQDQVARGWEVAVACPDGGDLAGWARAAGARHLPWQAGRDPGPSVPAETRALGRLLRAEAPSAVHLHSSKAGLAGRLALRGRVPTVFQPHAWSFEAVAGAVGAAAAGWERLALRWTDLLLCVSDDERARGRAAGVVTDRALVVPNGVDLQALRPSGPPERDRARAALGLPPGPLVVCVGRLARQKGQDVLLSALPRLREQVPGVRLALVGDGPDREALRARLPSSGSDDVVLPGGTTDVVLLPGGTTDVVPWLQAADVVALPSRWEAGLSLVAMEALALARPLVTTAVAGTGALGDAALVVPQEDPPALADALARLLRDAGLARRTGERGRALVEQRHDRRDAAQAVARALLALSGGAAR